MNISATVKKHLHDFLVLNALGMLWITVIKRGFDIYSVSLFAALLGLNSLNTTLNGGKS